MAQWEADARRTERPGVGSLIFVFVEKEVFLAGVIGPDVLDGFECITLVFQLLQILDNFERCAGAHGEVNQLVFAGGPRSVFEVGRQVQVSNTW